MGEGEEEEEGEKKESSRRKGEEVEGIDTHTDHFAKSLGKSCVLSVLITVRTVTVTNTLWINSHCVPNSTRLKCKEI